MIDVEVEDEAWRALTGLEEMVMHAAEAVLASDPEAPSEAAVVILLTDDATVRELNARFRGKDAATNVLSFPAADGAGDHLGDIALAYGVCACEADVQGKRLADHLAHLVVHGVLHLLGHDHEADDEAQAMEDRERAILAGLDVADPYRAERAGV